MALIETAISIGLLAGSIVLLKSLTHVAVFVLCAPLLLMRTAASVERAKQMMIEADLQGKRSDEDPPSQPYDDREQGWVTFAFMAIVARIWSVLRQVFITPQQCIEAIPNNFYRSTACLDLKEPSELIPGQLEIEDKHDFLLKTTRSGLHSLGLAVLFVLTLGSVVVLWFWTSVLNGLMWIWPLFLIAYVYWGIRIAFIILPVYLKFVVKATAPIYWPMYSILVGPVTYSELPDTLIDFIAEHPSSRERRWMGTISFLGLLSTAAVTVALPNTAKAYVPAIAWPFVQSLATPLALHPWQMASAIALLFTYLTWRVATAAKWRRDKHGEAITARTSRKIRQLVAVTAILSVYTSACFIYNLVRLAFSIRIVPFEWIFFPWEHMKRTGLP